MLRFSIVATDLSCCTLCSPCCTAVELKVVCVVAGFFLHIQTTVVLYLFPFQEYFTNVVFALILRPGIWDNCAPPACVTSRFEL